MTKEGRGGKGRRVGEGRGRKGRRVGEGRGGKGRRVGRENWVRYMYIHTLKGKRKGVRRRLNAEGLCL